MTRISQREGHSASLTARYAAHVNPAFVELLRVLGYGRVYVRAEGVTLVDQQGRHYLDALAGFGANNLGHSHPAVTEAIRQCLQGSPLHFNHVGLAAHEVALAEQLAGLLPEPLQVVLLASGGGEAVDAALKLARVATGRADLLYCRGGYHGTTLGTLSVMGASRMRKPVEPLLEHCHAVTFGDLDTLATALKRHRPAAFVVEPIQGEAGVVLPPPGYLADAQALCRRRGSLLILDEIQTGLGRVGSLFAFEREGFVPDVLVLAKSLSGGIVPISALVVSRELQQRAYGSSARFDIHSSTFGGNALACAAAQATLTTLVDERLSERSARLGKLLLDGLAQRLRDNPIVRGVRGRGLLVGIEIGAADDGLLGKLTAPLVGMISRQVGGQWIALRLLEEGIVAQPASHAWNVLKLTPPLIIGDGEVRRLVDAIGGIFDEYTSMAALVADVSRRLLAQRQRGEYAF